jgi:hypothetical protein
MTDVISNEKAHEEADTLVATMDEIGKQERWTTMFNEFCNDGVIRLVAIHPCMVTGIRKPDSPMDIDRFQLVPKEGSKFDGGTIITCNGREIRVFEPFNVVIQSLEASLTASDAWGASVFHAFLTFKRNNPIRIKLRYLNRKYFFIF